MSNNALLITKLNASESHTVRLSGVYTDDAAVLRHRIERI